MTNLQMIRSFITENFLFSDDESLNENESLLEQGIIDSTGILELVSFVESTFDITVADDDIVPENFDSISNVVNYLERKI